MGNMKSIANEIYFELGFTPNDDQMDDFLDFVEREGFDSFYSATPTEQTHLIRLWQDTWKEWPEEAVLHKIKKMINQLSLMALAEDLIPTLQAEVVHRIDQLLKKEAK